MKHFKILSLAILLSFVITGLAFSAQIPDITQPKTGDEAWVMQVYNNSGAALDDGDVVIWDVDSSSGDDSMWITTTTTVGTGPIAGVVRGDIGIAATGSVVVYGYATVDTVGGGAAAIGSAMVTSGTTGSAQNARHSTGEVYTLGYSLVATSSGSTIVFVDPGVQTR